MDRSCNANKRTGHVDLLIRDTVRKPFVDETSVGRSCGAAIIITDGQQHI